MQELKERKEEQMNILFTIDRGYVKRLAKCIQSIIRFPSEDGYDIYIMHSDLESVDETYLRREAAGKDVRIHFVGINIEETDFPESDRYPLQIYYRIFASFSSSESGKIIYLDADTIVINPLNELWKMEFNGNYFLACTHIRKVLNKINRSGWA